MAIVWRVEDEAERVLRARRAFRERLVAITVPPSDVDAAELIYGELVANTVRYANEGAVEAALEIHDGDAPVLVVRDRGPGLRACPWTPRRDPYAESGRGLGLVELLARDVQVDDARGGGTVIRATLPVVPRRDAA
ncbi:MAG TPA: ATP-binding protein [Candidatus Elarobacter sp.]|nr:ATP-binding protein [Candidatus Elarobacter sp.]